MLVVQRFCRSIGAQSLTKIPDWPKQARQWGLWNFFCLDCQDSYFCQVQASIIPNMEQCQQGNIHQDFGLKIRSMMGLYCHTPYHNFFFGSDLGYKILNLCSVIKACLHLSLTVASLQWMSPQVQSLVFHWMKNGMSPAYSARKPFFVVCDCSLVAAMDGIIIIPFSRRKEHS